MANNDAPEREIRSRVPFGQFQYVQVTFNENADEDTTIKHLLRGPKPDLIDWEVVRFELPAPPTTVPCVYRDGSPGRKPWVAGSITLRCNIPSFTCWLRLSTRRNEVE